ncbi:MAG: DUF6029 family protein [Myxococcales bacterium]
MTAKRLAALLGLVVALVPCAPASALELVQISDRTLRLDITASTVGAWNTDNHDGYEYNDDYGDLLNRVNLQLSYWRLVGAVRVDTAAYVNSPDPAALAQRYADPPGDPDSINQLQKRYWNLLRPRHRDRIWLGKAFVTYSSPEPEVTAGDSYVSFGRGLVLSLRKQDELALDNTLLGGKVLARWKNHLTATLVAGVANPVRVDEATGESLFALDPTPDEVAAGKGATPVFFEDPIFGARVEGSWQGMTLSLQGSWMLRTASLDDLRNFGATTGINGATDIQIGGASVSVPFPQGAGSLYLEGAYQHLSGPGAAAKGYEDDGFAFYGSVNAGAGILNGVLEVQHYRNFQALTATVNPGKVSSFATLQYTSPPTTEPATNDTRFFNFNRCATGGRLRVDGRVDAPLTVYGALGYWQTWGERDSRCLDAPRNQRRRNDITDVTGGLQLYFEGHRSHLFLSGGLRHDQGGEDAALFYEELHVELSFVKNLVGAWSLEFDGRERYRTHALENDNVPWNEGEAYVSVKWSPWLVLSLGFEYVEHVSGLSPYYNGSVVVKYTSDSNVRLFAGQQRGGLKCVSGMCRNVQPFEGVKLEWTQRY